MQSIVLQVTSPESRPNWGEENFAPPPRYSIPTLTTSMEGKNYYQILAASPDADNLPPVQLPDEQSKPFGHGLHNSANTLDFSPLIAQRLKHQTKHAEHCTRTKTTKLLPAAEETMRRQILRKFQELLKDSDQARPPGTAVERRARWNLGSMPAGAGNAANAAAVASAVASKRTKLFKQAKVPHFLQVSTGDVNQLKKLAIGDFGIVWTENGLMVAQGLVYEHFQNRQFRAFTEATASLQTNQFRLLVPFTFLCRLSSFPKTTPTGIELSAEDTKLFKELSEGIKSFDEAVKKSRARKKKEEEADLRPVPRTWMGSANGKGSSTTTWIAVKSIITVFSAIGARSQLRPWKKHKDTRKHRNNGGTENVALNDYLHRRRGGRSRRSPALTYDMDMDCFPTSDGATATAGVDPWGSVMVTSATFDEQSDTAPSEATGSNNAEPKPRQPSALLLQTVGLPPSVGSKLTTQGTLLHLPTVSVTMQGILRMTPPPSRRAPRPPQVDRTTCRRTGIGHLTVVPTRLMTGKTGTTDDQWRVSAYHQTTSAAVPEHWALQSISTPAGKSLTILPVLPPHNDTVAHRPPKYDGGPTPRCGGWPSNDKHGKYFPRDTTLALRSLRAKNCVDSLFDPIHSLIHISFSSAPSLTGLQVFGIQPAPPGQYYCTSERYIAAMYDLLDQLGSIVGNIHSISDTFIVPDGIAGGALLDVIMLPGSKPGICFSDIPGGWDLSMTMEAAMEEMCQNWLIALQRPRIENREKPWVTMEEKIREFEPKIETNCATLKDEVDGFAPDAEGGAFGGASRGLLVKDTLVDEEEVPFSDDIELNSDEQQEVEDDPEADEQDQLDEY
ncbi:hypothetical protein B0H14DRAFT_2573892 [Mycena olivaceomarginata]|nr:hypothetical protein B0H14DRAFT_2573892 [Mycena olivaceomarginata]